MKRFTAMQVKIGWIIYDTKLMRPVSSHTYSVQALAQTAADKLN